MVNMKLSENNRIEILWEDDIIYKSTVQEVNDNSLTINVPAANGEYLTLNKGDKISVINYDKSGSVYEFTCEIKNRKVDNSIPLYVTGEPYNIKKVQRRDHVRIELVEKIGYRKKEENNREVKEAILLDLSGGGAKVKFVEKIKLNDNIILNLNYEDEEIVIEGLVVRSYRSLEGDYICALLFNEIEEKTREKIINLVFKIMRAQRARCR